MKNNTTYMLQSEFDRDIFLFDTVVFPYYRERKYSLHKAYEHSLQNDVRMYGILNRLYSDFSGKSYIKRAFSSPKKFDGYLKEKYAGQSIEQIGKDNHWSIDTIVYNIRKEKRM